MVRSVHTGQECGVSPVYTFDLSGLFAGIKRANKRLNVSILCYRDMTLYTQVLSNIG